MPILAELATFTVANVFELYSYFFCSAFDSFEKIKENNNLDNSITFHTLRHSYATEFIKNGGDIWELKNILGHSSINTTSLYLHMAENFKDVYYPLNEVSKHV